ncbi:hypothetical protein BGZ88_000088 [Linnemannia elongata]|nr:hypothetical protein BGZ88_000088 [Linnemannia elongata]
MSSSEPHKCGQNSVYWGPSGGGIVCYECGVVVAQAHIQGPRQRMRSVGADIFETACAPLSVPHLVADLSRELFSRMEIPDVEQGPEAKVILAGVAIFLACRQSENQRSMQEVATVLGVTRNAIMRTWSVMGAP